MMKFGFFNSAGRIVSAHNDDTVESLPGGAIALTDVQWARRFDLRFDGNNLLDDPLPVEQVVPIPTTVTMRQARLALLQHGLLDQVDTAMQSAGQAERIEWEYAQGVDLDSPLVASMRDALGLTDDDVLGLFAIAGGL